MTRERWPVILDSLDKKPFVTSKGGVSGSGPAIRGAARHAGREAESTF